MHSMHTIYTIYLLYTQYMYHKRQLATTGIWAHCPDIQMIAFFSVFEVNQYTIKEDAGIVGLVLAYS